MTIVEIIDKHIADSDFATVAKNIGLRDVERCLTYLLGAQDVLILIGQEYEAENIRACRTEIKECFR